MLNHASLSHLLGNLLLLAVFAPPVWRALGAVRLAVLLLVTQSAGLLAQSLSDFLIADPRPLLGASAMGYGLVAAYGLLFPRSFPVSFIPATGRQIAVLTAACTLLLVMIAPRSTVAYAAHFGGVVGVFLLFDFMGWCHARKTVL